MYRPTKRLTPRTALTYTDHARHRSLRRGLPIVPALPSTARFYDSDTERGGSRYLVASHRGPLLLVVSDIEPGVVVTAYCF